MLGDEETPWRSGEITALIFFFHKKKLPILNSGPRTHTQIEQV